MASYTFSETDPNHYTVRNAQGTIVGDLRKRKRNWTLTLEGQPSMHPHRLSVAQYLKMLGHTCHGL